MDLKKWLIDIRRDFHQYPELGMEEKRTSEKIAAYLKEMKIEHIKGVGGTGIVGIIRGKYPGKTVAIRADIDALPMQDAKDVPYHSKIAGKSHACGHDAHTAILLGTAKILNDMKDDLKGTIKLFFQPAEESIGGARLMVMDGAMENPRVDAVFGLHVDPELNVGTIGIKYGKMNAASDNFDIIISGSSTHGAYPHSGIDSITAAGHIITSLQTVVSRNIDPRDSAVLSIGKISGGTANNIICDRVEMHGIIRTVSPKTREFILEKVKHIVKTTAEVFGARGEFIRHEGYPALINSDDCVDIIKSNGEKLLGKNKVVLKKDVSLGVEDFSYFLKKSKGAFFTLGCRNEEKGITYNLHNALFDIDEECLPIGVSMHVENVKRFLL